MTKFHRVEGAKCLLRDHELDQSALARVAARLAISQHGAIAHQERGERSTPFALQPRFRNTASVCWIKSPLLTREAAGVAAAPAACKPRNELLAVPMASVEVLKQFKMSGSAPEKSTEPNEESCHVQPDGGEFLVASAPDWLYFEVT